MDTDSHLLLDAAFGPYTTGELTYARQLMARVPDHSLTLFDRAYFAAAFLLDWQQAGQQRHWLMRAKTSLRFDVLQRLGPGDYWGRMPLSPQARQQRPDLPSHWEARLIETACGTGVRRYLTSLADARRYPARDLAAHYRQRWEIELGYREIREIADELDVPPQRLSFQWLALLCQQARCYVLPPRRQRSYPRQVKPRPQDRYPQKKMPVT